MTRRTKTVWKRAAAVAFGAAVFVSLLRVDAAVRLRNVCDRNVRDRAALTEDNLALASSLLDAMDALQEHKIAEYRAGHPHPDLILYEQSMERIKAQLLWNERRILQIDAWLKAHR